ncbi:DMT family transporter [Hyphomonas jannaschiana]|uniref:EamA domain-containing protein n=1 Tax=Hyphomonas jannaschiana VP2 TaxID=1280952 RepID=A0A059FIJ2_9PROT|nr:DMT family transporter [Hyphomonas jannaschiana]KCZ90356.1 hypothetical protein HJA_03976 [Hyphomonas jannaschiana VP2]
MPPLSSDLRLPYVAIVSAAALWGSGFYLTRLGLSDSGALGFVALRMGAAALCLMLLAGKSLQHITKHEVLGGCLVALTALIGYGGTAIALETEPSARVAFLSATYVLIVPAIQLLMYGEKPSPQLILGAFFALLGVGLMSGSLTADAADFSLGDMISLLSAVAIATEIVLLGRIMRSADPTRIAVVVLVSTAVLSAMASGVRGEPLPVFTPQLFGIIAVFGIMTAYIQFAMGWAQKRISAPKAAVIYATEPLFAALIGYAVGEALGVNELLGGLLIVLGVLVTAFRIRNPHLRSGQTS